ncbi:MAG TPA: ABC transporter ATP-binding protein [Phycisphaerales bacterium]|nr:ABC transporter ATP-binding protein [Phycisphaerales bacterium]
MPTRIVIDQLEKTYPAIAPAPGSPPTTTAVDRVSLTIEPGELFFLLGPSGCGKTTLLRMIAGFIEPTSGRVLFELDGSRSDVTFMPAEKRDTGMVFQSYALWPHMTVARNVAFGLEVRGVPREERERRVREALAQVRMDQYAERKPNQLSGGQQQRVALARAMVIRPRVLLLDEPLSNLDARLRIELRSEIRRICKASGTTTVYVTHDQKEALSMADRIAIMRSGKLIQVGEPEALYYAPGSRFVAEFLGETNIVPAHVEHIADGIVQAQAPWGPVLCASVPSVAPGQQVLLSIRPESISLSRGENSFPATVQDRVFLGEHSQLALAVGPTTLVASVPGALAARDSSGVQISIPREAIAIIPAE